MKTREGQVGNNAQGAIVELAFAVALVFVLMNGYLNNWVVNQGFHALERTGISGAMNGGAFPSVVSGLKWFFNSHSI